MTDAQNSAENIDSYTELAKTRVGVYAGTFDPVHAGHITFALQALQEAKLDAVYFLPERQPRGKKGVEHFGHRVAMLSRAAQPHPRIDVLELVDANFTVRRTLSQLERLFPGARLVWLFGSDAALSISTWEHAERFLEGAELVIGLRSKTKRSEAEQRIGSWPAQPSSVTIIESHAPHVSSAQIREALHERRRAQGLLTSVARYSDRHWLYVSVA